jgi:hypothetical protein
MTSEEERMLRRIAMAVAVGLLGVACNSGGAGTSVYADEAVHAEGLEDLVAESGAVVEGQVLAVGPGRAVGDAADSFQLTLVTIGVDAIHAGTYPDPLLLVEEDGVVEELPAVGDRGVFFVVPKGGDEAPFYRLVSSQGMFIETDEGLRGSNDEADWVKELEGLTLEQLAAQVQAEADSPG